MQDLIETATFPIYAAALALLWIFEALLPAFHGWKTARGQRVRHLALAGLNAAAAGLAALVIAAAVAAAEGAGIGLFRWIDAPLWVAFVVSFLALDLTHYGFHVAAHKVPWLWRLHAVHHHATTMEATAALRFHTLEIPLSCLAPLPVILLLGMGLPEVLLYNAVLMPVAMFHHADIRLPRHIDRRLRWLIVTPRMHWIHHSRWQPETDSNFASVLSVWDRLFGTMRSRRHAEKVEFGLDGFDESDTQTLRGWLMTPFSGRRATLGERPAARLLEPDGPETPRRRSGDASERGPRGTPASATMPR